MSLVQSFANGSKDVQDGHVIETGTRNREGEEGWAQSFGEGSQWERSATARGEASSFGEDVRFGGREDAKGKGRAIADEWGHEFQPAQQAQQRQGGSGSLGHEDLYLQPTGYGHLGGGMAPAHFAHTSYAPQPASHHHQQHQVSSTAAVNQTWDAHFQSFEDSLTESSPAKTVHFDPVSDAYQSLSQAQLSNLTSIPRPSSSTVNAHPETSLFSSSQDADPIGSTSAWEEDLLFGEDESAFQFYNGPPHHQLRRGVVRGQSETERDAMAKMEGGWDALGGIGRMPDEGKYVFQTGNPWLNEKWADRERATGYVDGLQVCLNFLSPLCLHIPYIPA